MRATTLFPLSLIGLMGCNAYDMFRLTGFEQASFSNKADILFVVDNSDSMVTNASSLATNFDGFIAGIQEQTELQRTEDLNDAVDNYTTYVSDRAANLNYQFGITTMDVDTTWGELSGNPANRLVERGEERVAERFIDSLLCDSTCFSTSGGGGDFSSGDLDDLCGEGKWEENCGAGREEGLEAVFMAMCRAVPNPPEECFNDIQVGDDVFPANFTDADILTNEGLMRERATFMPIIVTDEGDDSRRMARSTGLPDVYEALFQKFGVNMSWVVIGPALDDQFELTCPGTATDWGAIRYEYFVQTTNGLKISVHTPDCEPADFEPALDQLGELLSSLLSSFSLQSIPKAETIMVFIDGVEIEQSEITATDNYGLDIYSSGWQYQPEDNSILFHGSAIPPNDADVKVYYEPLDGMPRELPF
jgi:hypothetical protein